MGLGDHKKYMEQHQFYSFIWTKSFDQVITLQIIFW